MSLRYFVVRAEESQRYPIAVVRVSPDGTEEAFTHALEWGPSNLLAQLNGEPTVIEIAADDVEQLVVDIIVGVRAERYEVPYGEGTNIYVWFARPSDVLDLDKACAMYRDHGNGKRERFLPPGVWSTVWGPVGVPESYYYMVRQWRNPRSTVRVAISAEEADRLASRGIAWTPTPFVVPADDTNTWRSAREYADGRMEVLTEDLCWEPFEWHGKREDVGSARDAMILHLRILERTRPVPPREDGYDYSVLFEDFEQVGDLMLARNLVRLPDGDPETPQEWTLSRGWRGNFWVRHRMDAREWYDAELPITKAEADEYVRLHTEWDALSARVYRRLGN
ncbi:hypothetical protein JNUCC0626_17165 [Lentzea sp. JNUCC 0626]|uniref:hypothetical protein n=1 Tax=Lentzea sp. JNUCC 0626 TaxID=3367513 RepID=UPI003749CB74